MNAVPWRVWLGAFAVVLAAPATGCDVDGPSATGDTSPPTFHRPAAQHDSAHVRRAQRERDRPRRHGAPRHTTSTPRSTPTSTPTSPPTPIPSPEPAAPRTYLVVHVVDGDTLDLGNGERVRLVGIDTPEVGECGYDAASAALARMVLDRPVRLTTSDEDRDRYGRLLRYVDVGGTDAGLQLVRRGLAIARYDSRDGYGFHPREPAYVAADRDSRPLCARPATLAAPVAPAPAPAEGCAPGYSPCVPPGPPDLDCADVAGPVRVTGSDPHRLDGDGDGVACE